jgi:uncharacterized membrane protein AbrB (regulator of aidB expression)
LLSVLITTGFERLHLPAALLLGWLLARAEAWPPP